MNDLNSPKGKSFLWKQVVYLQLFVSFIAFFFPFVLFQNIEILTLITMEKINGDNLIDSFSWKLAERREERDINYVFASID